MPQRQHSHATLAQMLFGQSLAHSSPAPCICVGARSRMERAFGASKSRTHAQKLTEQSRWECAETVRSACYLVGTPAEWSQNGCHGRPLCSSWELRRDRRAVGDVGGGLEGRGGAWEAMHGGCSSFGVFRSTIIGGCPGCQPAYPSCDPLQLTCFYGLQNRRKSEPWVDQPLISCVQEMAENLRDVTESGMNS